MNVTAWRITKRKFASDAFSGEGAREYGGRWNSRGTAMVYAAQSQALAALEMLVNLNASQLLGSYVAIPVTLDSTLIEALDVSKLPKNWADEPAPPALHAIGDEWVREARAVALQVPSAVVPAEFNYLLNPAHPNFAKLTIGAPVSFRFDRRLRNR